MSDKLITLYYANWCPACVNFKPTWNKLKETFDEKGISYAEYESDKNPNEIQAANIFGFPTIKVLNGGKNEDYEGPRDFQSILNYVLGEQSGGTPLDDEEIFFMNKLLNKKQTGGNIKNSFIDQLIEYENQSGGQNASPDFEYCEQNSTVSDNYEMMGGAADDPYYRKYLKYKTKYFGALAKKYE